MKNTLLLVLILTTSVLFSQSKLFKEAKKDHKNENFQSAISKIEEVSKNPETSENMEVWNEKAYIYRDSYLKTFENSNFDNMLKSIDRLKELDTRKRYADEINIEYSKLHANLFNTALQLYNEKKFDLSGEIFNNTSKIAEKIDKIDTTSIYWSGNSFYNIKNNEKAIESYEKCLNYNFRTPYLMQSLSSLYSNSNQKDKANDLLSKAFELYPNNSDIIMSIIKLKIDDKKLEEAETILNKSFESNPKNSNLYYAAGVLYNDMNNYEKAIEFYNKTLEIDPNNENSKYNICITYNNQILKINEEMNSIPLDNEQKYNSTKERRDTFIKNVLPNIKKYYIELNNDNNIRTVYNQLAKVIKEPVIE